MARVNSDGSLDTTFGTGGFAPVISPASAIVLQSNAQILLPASRYNANGSVDTTFGTLGRIASLGHEQSHPGTASEYDQHHRLRGNPLQRERDAR